MKKKIENPTHQLKRLKNRENFLKNFQILREFIKASSILIFLYRTGVKSRTDLSKNSAKELNVREHQSKIVSARQFQSLAKKFFK